MCEQVHTRKDVKTRQEKGPEAVDPHAPALARGIFVEAGLQQEDVPKARDTSDYLKHRRLRETSFTILCS